MTDLLQALHLGRQSFPGIWRKMMPAGLMQLRFPEERQAQCGHCPKACYESWRADYRCCTYHPRMSNFLLGLACHSPKGEEAVDELLKRGMLLPEGMHSSPRQWLAFVTDEHEGQFGKSSRVLCPLLDPDSGLCRAHAFRNSVCSTYFCEKDHGAAGSLFWSQIQTLGTQLEMRLAQWALREIGFDLEASLRTLDELADRITEVSSDEGWQKEALQAIWGSWWGREKELLLACAALVVKHQDELWSIAQRQVIAEPHRFDQALLLSAPPELQEILEDTDAEWEEVSDLEELWDDCLRAHEQLWEKSCEAFILSPNVSFLPNQRRTAEERYHADKDFFLEYRFQNPERSLHLRLAISQQQKNLLESFRDTERQIQEAGPEAQDFLQEMMHQQVLWPSGSAPAGR